MDYNQVASNGVYVDVGQAAIIRSGGSITRLATNKVVGCLGVVLKNTTTGDMGLIHIMANLSGSDLNEEYEDLIKPTIDSLMGDEQTLEVEIFGGNYDEGNETSGQQFKDQVIDKIQSIENVNITTILTGDTPHPTGVVIDVSSGETLPRTAMVTSYDQAIKESSNIDGFDSFTKPIDDPLYFGIIYEEPRTNAGALNNAPDIKVTDIC